MAIMLARMVVRVGQKRPHRNFLRQWREHRGLTQQQLADRLDTAKGQISNWENGKRGMSDSVIYALADALQISPGELFRDPETPSADELLRDATPEQRKMALEIISTIVQRPSGTDG